MPLRRFYFVRITEKSLPLQSKLLLHTIMGTAIGLLIPLLGTMLDAALVFFMKKDMSPMPLQANNPTSAPSDLP